MRDVGPAPLERSYWVLPGELLAGAYPADHHEEATRALLSTLLDAGILLLLDLTEEGEVTWGGEAARPYAALVESLAVARGAGVRCVRHPIPDDSVPSAETMTRILDEIDASLAAGRPVYVHCWGGIGRTGTVVGCYLSRHGIARGEEALDRIAELRADEPLGFRSSPESREQREMVIGWGAR